LLPVSSSPIIIYMECKKLSHCTYLCDYHLVLTPKYRRKIFNEGIFAYLDIKLIEIRKHYPLIEIKESNHDVDHIHLFISIPPTISVGSVVRIIKSNTGREMKQKFPFLQKLYWGSGGIWSDGYFVSTVGVDEKVIRDYINKQGEEDTGQAKLELG